MKTLINILPSPEINYSTCDLLLIAGERYFSFGILDHISRELSGFKLCTFEQKEELELLFQDEELLRQRYNQVLIAYDTYESVFIPTEVYNKDELAVHLDVLYGKNVDHSIVSESLPALDIYNVYRVSSGLQKTIQSKFTNNYNWQFYSVLLKNAGSAKKDTINVEFKTDEFTVLVQKSGKMILAQTFNYSAPNDVLYYFLKISQQLNLSQQETEVLVSGLIEKDSALYRELYKYFINIEFDSIYGQVKLGEELKTNPEHYYSSISKLAACV